MSLSGNCPNCATSILTSEDVEESEILVCSDCLSQLKVEFIKNKNLVLNQAPDIEEDWEELKEG